jgi:hypothetical protein
MNFYMHYKKSQYQEQFFVNSLYFRKDVFVNLFDCGNSSVLGRFSLQVFHIMPLIYCWSKVLIFLFMFELHAWLLMFYFHALTIDH